MNNNINFNQQVVSQYLIFETILSLKLLSYYNFLANRDISNRQISYIKTMIFDKIFTYEYSFNSLEFKGKYCNNNDVNLILFIYLTNKSNHIEKFEYNIGLINVVLKGGELID